MWINGNMDLNMINENVLNELASQVATMLNKEAVDPDATLSEIGIDSLNVVELILICEQLYPNMVDPQSLSFDEYTTLRELDRQLRTNSQGVSVAA